MAAHEIEIFIMMSEDGSYELGGTEDEAIERFDENIGGYPRRLAKITAKMAAPVIVEASVTIPDEDATLTASA